MTEKSKIAVGVRRGLGLRCPQCGKGRLFGRFLKVSEHCGGCGADNTIYPSDDAPPYVTLFVVTHLLLPFIFWVERAWELPLWITFSIWLPVIAVITIVMLPYIKGGVIGFAWATGVTRGGATQ